MRFRLALAMSIAVLTAAANVGAAEQRVSS